MIRKMIGGRNDHESDQRGVIRTTGIEFGGGNQM